jgi:hypothetical protein
MRPASHTKALTSFAALAAFIACASARPAAAQEQFAGKWLIASAVIAPWAGDPADAADTADAKRLVKQQIIFAPGSVRAPKPLGCAKATYEFRDATPDGLFEGSLNADGAGKTTDPVVVAQSLGLTGASFRAMTASCSEVEFVLADANTMLFGLNNRVFTAKRR